jgi:hypothetical protein
MVPKARFEGRCFDGGLRSPLEDVDGRAEVGRLGAALEHRCGDAEGDEGGGDERKLHFGR